MKRRDELEMEALAFVAVRQAHYCQMCVMQADTSRPVSILPAPAYKVATSMPCELCTPGSSTVPAVFVLCREHLDDLNRGHRCPHGIAMIVSEPIEIPVEERK